MKIPIEIAGRPLDFSEAGIRIPVVHVKVASLLSERAPREKARGHSQLGGLIRIAPELDQPM